MGIPNDTIQLITVWLKDWVAYVEVGSLPRCQLWVGSRIHSGHMHLNYYMAPLVMGRYQRGVHFGAASLKRG